MRRAQQSLSADEIREVLRTARRGVLSVTGDDGWPYGVYVNPFYAEPVEGEVALAGVPGKRLGQARGDLEFASGAAASGSPDGSAPP